MALIELNNASLTFRVTEHGPVRMRDWLLEKVTHGRKSRILKVEALKQVDLKLTDGERIGIIGHNGAGKSTLLKVLADIYPLTSGTRRVNGSISSLFDLALGFELDATGWENIAYRSYLQGESRREMRRKMGGIAEFSELGRHLDLPISYYSDGMRVRLAFAIATAIEPDILLLDEAFNAGDQDFRNKAENRIADVMAKARIVIAISHEHEVLERLCDQLIWMEKGRIKAMGPSGEILSQYLAQPRSTLPTSIAA